MQCYKINQFIEEEMSEKEFEQHVKECSYCEKMYLRLNEAFSLLDINADVPANMAEKIMQKKNKQTFRISFKRDIATIIQIACVMIAGIFLGIVLGKNSDTHLLLSKDSERKQSLIEYRDIHHFNVNADLFH